MSKLYFYSLACKEPLKELKEIGKKWKGVSIIGLCLEDMEKMTPETFNQLGRDIVAKLIEHNNKK